MIFFLLLLYTKANAQIDFLFEKEGARVSWNHIKGASLYHVFCYKEAERRVLLYTCTTKENSIFIDRFFLPSAPLYIVVHAYKEGEKLQELSSSSIVHPKIEGEWIKCVRIRTHAKEEKKKRLLFMQNFSVCASFEGEREHIGYSVHNVLSFPFFERIAFDADLLYERGKEQRITIGGGIKLNTNIASLFTNFKKTLGGNDFFSLGASFHLLKNSFFHLGFTKGSIYANCNWYKKGESATFSFHHTKHYSFLQAGYTINY